MPKKWLENGGKEPVVWEDDVEIRWETQTPTRPLWNCGLHPLIHTLLEFNLPQDIESIESGAEALHFLSLNQGIVARS